MTLYCARLIDVPLDPFVHDPSVALRVEDDDALLVRDGIIEKRGPWTQVRARHPHEPLVETHAFFYPDSSTPTCIFRSCTSWVAPGNHS